MCYLGGLVAAAFPEVVRLLAARRLGHQRWAGYKHGDIFDRLWADVTSHVVVTVAALMGREVRGIRLHSDTSGLTTHAGSTKRLPLALASFAGYPARALVGLAAAYALHRGYAFALIWAVVLLPVLVLVQICNVFGFLVLVLAIAGLGWLAWAAPDSWRVGITYGVVWVALFWLVTVACAAAGAWFMVGEVVGG